MKRYFWLIWLLLLPLPSLSAQIIVDRPLSVEVPVAKPRPTMEQLLARADSLHRAYRFHEAMDLYLAMGAEEKAAASQNGLNMRDFCADPQVVARQRFSRSDFFLYYPLEQQAWRPSPNPLDSLSGFPLYFPKGADAIYYSAPDRSGSRSLFVTEDLDSLWRAPRHLGEALLSTGSEIFPMLSPDGKTLYFASDGLYGMGGYDLYSSAWDAENGCWGAPVNMGFPFSSPADDFLLVDTADGKYTLFASNRDCSPDSVVVYVLDFSSSRARGPVRSHEELVRIASLSPAAPRTDNQSAVSSEVPGNANTRLYARKMEEARTIIDAIAAGPSAQALDSLRLLLEEVNLELRLIEQTFLQSGVVSSTEDREPVGAPSAYTFAKNAMGGRLKMRLGRHVRNHSYRVMPMGRFAPDNTLPAGIVYQIELFSMARRASLDDLHGLSPVYERLGSNLRYTYYAGLFPTYADALLELNSIRALGFPEAHVTAWRDGRQIAVSLARNEE